MSLKENKIKKGLFQPGDHQFEMSEDKQDLSTPSFLSYSFSILIINEEFSKCLEKSIIKDDLSINFKYLWYIPKGYHFE